MVTHLHWIPMFAVTALTSYFMVNAVRRWAVRVQFLSVPNERSSHSTPIPLGGGLALVVVNVAVWVALAVLHFDVARPVTFMSVGALIIALVSWLDDRGHVPFPIRLACHLGSASIFVAGVGTLDGIAVPVLGHLHFGLLAFPITVLFVAGLVNSFNFMDGIDGMAAGLAASAAMSFAVLLAITGLHSDAIIAVILAASCLGFLRHNWHPARIFMGDVGSTFLGYALATLTVTADMHDSRFGLVGIVLVWPALFDSGFTVLRRLRRRENIFAGHRSFLFHRLVASGWSHAETSRMYLALPLMGGFVAYAWDYEGQMGHILIGSFIAVLSASLWLLVVHEEYRLKRQIPAYLHSLARQPIKREQIRLDTRAVAIAAEL